MLKKHYKYSNRKSMKPYLRLLLLFLILIIFSGTISRYINGAVGDDLINIAKWSIRINDEEITPTSSELNTDINLYNFSDNSTIIDSGDDCYFDIIINSVSTEVAICYSIDIDLVNSNLPNGTKIKKYEKYVNTGNNETLSHTENLDSTSVLISEEISLPDGNTALNDTSIRRYRVYCKIPFPADIIKENGLSIEPHISVNQLIDD